MKEGAVVDKTGAAFEKLGIRVVALLLILQLILVFFLWTLDPIGPGAQAAFALYLASVLVSFAMTSYVYRALKRDHRVAKTPLLAGCCFVALTLFLGLFP